jgi:uncharacterized protein with PQ loop repeat
VITSSATSAKNKIFTWLIQGIILVNIEIGPRNAKFVSKPQCLLRRTADMFSRVVVTHRLEHCLDKPIFV